MLSETTLFLRQDPHALAVLTDAVSDDLQQYFAGVRCYLRDVPVVAVLCPILPFVEYHADDHDGTFPLRHAPPPPNKNDDIEQPPSQGGITVEGDLEQLTTEIPSGSTAFPFANEWMAPVSSCIVG